MGKEIERKFLIDTDTLGPLEGGSVIKQGYIETASKTVVRVRIRQDQAFLTLKGANNGAVRSEFEYAIPLTDANEILAELCNGPIVEKTRYLVPLGKHTWEIDVFHGDNKGLVVAEIELSCVDEGFDRPPWITQEVTDDARYYNSNLLAHPYKAWPKHT